MMDNKYEENNIVSKLGKLEKVNLRNIWPNEEYDFSVWLSKEENLRELSDTIGIDIVLEERESAVGKYSVDIYAKEDGTDRKVVIENQLEDSNHDHLGKIITYASGKDAKTIIWIVKKARDEHRQAVDWLNSHTDEEVGFFLLEIEAWRIGDSPIAPKFNIVSQPNDWGKVQKVSTTLTNAKKMQLEFWQAFGEYGANNVEYSKEFNKRKALPQHWYNLPAGSSEYHISLTCATQKNEVGIEIYITDNKNIYDLFYKNKNIIEERTRLKYKWQRLDNKKASRIKTVKKCNIMDQKNWAEVFSWLCDNTLLMKKEFNKIYNSNI